MIILASHSPRRKQLLELANIKFEIMVANTSELIDEKLPIQEIPIYIAKEKATTIANTINKSNKTIIAADTIVAMNETILGKPKNRDEAVRFLQELSGKTHQVITGVVVLKNDDEICFSETTEVEFHHLTNNQIEYYVNNYKPYDKAGAYAIQEWIGIVGIKKINGDFYNVMGLPVSRILPYL